VQSTAGDLFLPIQDSTIFRRHGFWEKYFVLRNNRISPNELYNVTIQILDGGIESCTLSVAKAWRSAWVCSVTECGSVTIAYRETAICCESDVSR